MENLERTSDGAALPVSSYSPDDDDDDIGLRGYSIEMYTRRFHALTFRKIRRAGKCAFEEKFCVLPPCGFPDYWHENMYGFTRVVVHGVDSLCVVARTKDVERVMCQAKEAYPYMCDLVLKSALIYEAEDLALHHGELGKMTSRTLEKPFVAVSVTPDPKNSVPEASSDEYDVESVIRFVWEEMHKGTSFTFDESVKTAISTLQHLFGKRFKANEIKVFYVKNHSGRVVGGRGCSEKANVLPMRGERCINDHLAVINNPRSGGSSSSGVVAPGMENLERTSDGAALPVSSYSPDDDDDNDIGLRGYSIDFYEDGAAIDPFDPKLKRRIDRLYERPSDAFWDFGSGSNPLSDTISCFGSKDARKSSSKFFLDHAVKSQSNCSVLKGCSWSGGNKLWSEKWLGITWVALHGLDSLCVVARKNDLLHLEKTVYVKRSTDTFLSSFWNVIVSDVEDIEERLFGGSCLRPFSVVTVGATCGAPISRVRLTSMFLQGKLKLDPSLTFEKTIQTALLANQFLYDREFEAGELQVFVWQKDQIFGKELLQFRENPDLEEYLAFLNVSE